MTINWLCYKISGIMARIGAVAPSPLNFSLLDLLLEHFLPKIQNTD